jgi:protein-disulfide isomerase
VRRRRTSHTQAQIDYDGGMTARMTPVMPQESRDLLMTSLISTRRAEASSNRMSMPRWRRLAAASVGAAALAMPIVCDAQPVATDTFTPAQRQEIISVVRNAMRQDPSILRDAVNALQAEDSARADAASRSALASTRDQLVTPSDPVAGNPKGDVTIVEFFDTRCPYCRRMEPVMSEFLAQDHNVRLVYKDLPILGAASVLGSKALLAAQRQNGYEKLRTAVMKLPPETTKPMIQAAAEKAGLDWSKLARDMDDPTIQQQIDANLKLARTLNIQGTPALVVGNQIVPGAVDLDELTKAVAEARRTG